MQRSTFLERVCEGLNETAGVVLEISAELGIEGRRPELSLRNPHTGESLRITLDDLLAAAGTEILERTSLH